jgi:uncharacterized protein (TIGR02145 family)
MKIRFILFTMLAGIFCLTYGQTLDMDFTGVNHDVYIRLDSIRVMNCSQECDTLLVWPDTVLSVKYTGVNDISHTESAFRVFPCFPNPVAERTSINMYVPESDIVKMRVIDMFGRVVLESERLLGQGQHTFSFIPGDGNIYLFSACWRGTNGSIRILNTGSGNKGKCALSYTGTKGGLSIEKQWEDDRDFVYYLGNKLLCIGYAGKEESGMIISPDESSEYTLNFAYGIPCPGIPTVEYGGQVYHTVQVASQCWLKENLNVGTRINGMINQTENGIIEKYCYNDNPDNCTTYGGLYQWDEMMQYSTQEGVQGICPPGWHIPADLEWKVLEGVADSLYHIGDTIWDISWARRGFDAAKNLKSVSGWWIGSHGTDLLGFSALPGGDRFHDGLFYLAGGFGLWWTSTQYSKKYSWYRLFYYYYTDIYRNSDFRKQSALSVRCLRDD